MKKAFAILLRVIVSAAILLLLFEQVDRRSLFAVVKDINFPLLFLAFLVFSSAYILCFYRWLMLLRAADIHLPARRVLSAFAGGNFFSLFLPSTIGGDFVRVVDLGAHTQKPRQVLATVFLDRLSGYVGLVLLATLAVLFGSRIIEEEVVFISLAVVIGILVAILLVLFNRPVFRLINRLLDSPSAGRARGAIKRLHEEMHDFGRDPKMVIKNILFSMAIQAVSPVTFYILGLSLGMKINPVYLFVIMPIIGAITLLPVSIGGLGLRDAATIVFFAKIGIAKNVAFAMSLLSFVFILIYGCAGGIIYALTLRYRRV